METEKDLPLFAQRFNFFLKIYGISGARSTHPCIFCKASKAQIQTPPHFDDGNISKWTLENRGDNIRYWHSRKNVAKLYNAIRRPLVNIEQDHVMTPHLHILLGITKKYHNLLKGECLSLAKLIRQSLASSGQENTRKQCSLLQGCY